MRSEPRPYESKTGRFRRTIGVLGLVCLVACGLGGAWLYQAARSDYFEIYLSPEGNDAAPGTRGQPVATLDRARQLARQAFHRQKLPVRVNMRGGSYVLSSPVVFGSQDSGSAKRKIVYASYKKEKVVLSGGEVISNWQRVKNTSLNLWEAPFRRGADTRDLWIDGERRPLSRTVAPLTSIGANHSAGKAEAWSPAAITQTSRGYIVNDASPRDWANPEDAELIWSGVAGNGLNGWAEPRCGVAGVNAVPGSASNTEIAVDQPCFRNVTANRHDAAFSVRFPSSLGNLQHNNDFRTQIRPGEWQYNTSRGVLTYFAHAWEDPAKLDVTAGRLETVLAIHGGAAGHVHDLVFEGFAVSGTTWLAPSAPSGFAELQGNQFRAGDGRLDSPVGAVSIRSASHILLRDVEILGSGGSALKIEEPSGDIGLVDSKVADSGGNCISIGGVVGASVEPSRQVRDITIENNTISGCGRTYRGGVGIFVGYARDVRILSNEIRDTSWSGISLGWGWGNPSYLAGNVVSRNVLSGAMEGHALGIVDGAAIYLNGPGAKNTPTSATRNALEGNWITQQGPSVAAIVLDNSTSNWDILDNVIQGVDASYAWVLGGGANVARGNYSEMIPDRYVSRAQTNLVRDNYWGSPSAWPARAEEIKNAAGPRSVPG